MVRPFAPLSISVVVDPHKKIIPTIRRILRCRSSPHRAGVLTVNIGLQYPDFHLFPSGLLTKSHYDANSISWILPATGLLPCYTDLRSPRTCSPPLTPSTYCPDALRVLTTSCGSLVASGLPRSRAPRAKPPRVFGSRLDLVPMPNACVSREAFICGIRVPHTFLCSRRPIWHGRQTYHSCICLVIHHNRKMYVGTT